MTKTTSHFSVAIGMAMLASMVVLSACGGPEPMTRTTTSETTTTTPRPVISTTTTTENSHTP